MIVIRFITLYEKYHIMILYFRRRYKVCDDEDSVTPMCSIEIQIHRLIGRERGYSKQNGLLSTVLFIPIIFLILKEILSHM